LKIEVDYIIVGQGLAGSLMAWFLEKNKKSFVIIDEHKGETASIKATGLINPITGRRFVKSWMVEELMTFAEKTYSEFEKTFDCTLFQQTKVHRILQSVEQENDWSAKTEDSRYKYFLQNKNTIFYDNNIVNNPFGCIEIEPILKVNTPFLIHSISDYFENKNLIQREKFDYDELKILNDKVQYKNITAKNLIFCEGHLAIHNPYFNYLPFLLSKGEVLIFESKELKLQCILGGNSNITPLGNDTYSIGATYAWDDLTLITTKEKREWLTQKLETSINCKYKIIDQKAGIRPTVKDRRPLLGTHSVYNKLHFFNGMGTKGLSLAPYFAHHFVNVLLGKETLMQDVSIERFIPF